MTRKFADLIKDFPPERLDRIERRKKELEEEMGVRRIDLETDEVEYDSRKGHNIVPEHEYVREEVEPRLEEHRWIDPLRSDKIEKIVLDDEALAKLRGVLAGMKQKKNQ